MNYLDFKDKSIIFSISEYNRKEEVELIMTNNETEEEMIVAISRTDLERLRDWCDNLLE